MESEKPFASLSKGVLELKAAKTFDYSDRASKLARNGREIISLGIGQPFFPTPRHIVDAAVEALREGFTRYVSPPGIPELREEIATYVSSFTGAGDVAMDETLVTAGAKPAMFFAISTFIEPGDQVIIPDPSFYSYAHVVRYAGGKPVFVPLREERDFSLCPEEVQEAVTEKTKMLILNSPHNPTGGMMSRTDLKAVLEISKEGNLLVVSDEVYDHYTYEGGFMSALEDSDWRDYVIYVNSFSKTYSMTGWRLGYIVARKEAIKRFSLFTANTASCTTSFVQKAGVAALSGPQDFFKKYIEDYNEMRTLAYKKIEGIPGVGVKRPRGAFYIFPNIEGILDERKTSAEEFAKRLMEEKGVVVLPGSAFPHRAGEGHLRVSYSLPLERLKRGLERLVIGIQDWREGSL